MDKETFLSNYREALLTSIENKVSSASSHYDDGVKDCINGIYDKWYRYNTSDDGQAYNAGWMSQNKIQQNDKVKFIEFNIL